MARLSREQVLKMKAPRCCQRNIPDKGRCRNHGNLWLVENMKALGFKWDTRWYCKPCVDVLMEMLGYPEITEVENLDTGEIRQVSNAGNA